MRGKAKLLTACVLAGALAVPLGAAAETATQDSHPAKEHPNRGGEMRLDCKPFRHEDRLGVGCQWSPSKARDFAGYRLMRGERGQEPQTVFAGRDRRETRALDESAQAGHEYVYVVLAVDADGEVIGHSNPVRVSTRGRPDRPSDPVALPAVPTV